MEEAYRERTATLRTQRRHEERGRLLTEVPRLQGTLRAMRTELYEACGRDGWAVAAALRGEGEGEGGADVFASESRGLLVRHIRSLADIIARLEERAADLGEGRRKRPRTSRRVGGN